ncbi:OPT family oligopeptide transporter [Gemmatimonadota bacterium]
MNDKDFKPFVPAETSLKELTFKALLLGIVMAVVLGAANAYLGLKAGMTVSATFPAAVVAMAVMRIFRGSILEENISRTTASAGEALVAGAIFTLPAFMIAGVWTDLSYWDSTLIMLVGGILGVLFVVILRRPLVEEADLPFPESKACAEIVKAGQHGQTGAKYVFGAMGLAAFFEFFKNSNGIKLITEHVTHYLPFKTSHIDLFPGTSSSTAQAYGGGMLLQTPAASPALIGVGYIIGIRLASWAFAGGVMGWLVLIPLAIFFNPSLDVYLAGENSWNDIADQVWRSQVRPFAVGAMLVASFFTLLRMRKPLVDGISKAFKEFNRSQSGEYTPSRLEIDLNYKWVSYGVVGLIIPITLLYWYFCGSLFSAIVAAVVMTIAGFLFSAVAGYLVGLIGGSNNPISGLTLSTLIVAALLMVLLGTTGKAGIAAVLGVAGVVCCTCGIAGDMLQDLKVGHILGGTPKRMEIAEILGVIAASFVLAAPLWLLHNYAGGLGGAELPAPQAGLMAMMAKGIVGGDMAWPLVFMGGFFALGLILLGGGSPMLVAVGMYLPFTTTFAMFVGGLIKWVLELRLRKREEKEKQAADKTGLLLASGFVAGESLTAVLLAVFVFLKLNFTVSPIFDWSVEVADRSQASWYESYLSSAGGSVMPWLGLIIFSALIYVLLAIPASQARQAAQEPIE